MCETSTGRPNSEFIHCNNCGQIPSKSQSKLILLHKLQHSPKVFFMTSCFTIVGRIIFFLASLGPWNSYVLCSGTNMIFQNDFHHYWIWNWFEIAIDWRKYLVLYKQNHAHKLAIDPFLRGNRKAISIRLNSHF